MYHPFIWHCVRTYGKLTWKTMVAQGTYVIDHETYLIQFIRLPPHSSIEMINKTFTSLEEAQQYCELHWREVVDQQIVRARQSIN